MNTNVTTIFDLSPDEKLQLVEDLWDDLAATPDVVPVHDWQKRELARRKENLMKNPASGMTWDELKHGSANAMAAKIVLAPEAEQDMDEGYAWYEERRAGLGEEFLSHCGSVHRSHSPNAKIAPLHFRGVPPRSRGEVSLCRLLRIR